MKKEQNIMGWYRKGFKAQSIRKSMSEELTQRNLSEKGITLIDYEFFPLHSTTIKQYKKVKIIPNKDYGKYEIRKPDGLVVDRGDKSKPKVVVALEYKKPSEFQTDKQKREAIEQCNDLAQELGANIGVITDGIVTYWINPNHQDKKNEYKDKTTNKKRSFSFIFNDDKQRLQKKFFIKERDRKNVNKLDDETRETYRLIKRVLSETNHNNSILKATEKTDPTSLARSVWQSIYISTHDNATACLYNVVEIFIFKFLSDLGVLQGINSFDYLLNLYKTEDNQTVLRHYVKTSREEIRKLFRAGDDGTSIINGTIFVTKDGNPVLSQAGLFKETIEKYAKFEDLRNIDKGFKTRLFETFLKQSKDKSKLGQFFTPRKVVKGIVEMADVDKAEFICDPFCGVGGFVLEPFQLSQTLKNKFRPKNNKIDSKVKILGYDTGREDNEEQKRTIILAKANMLIYLSDLVEEYPNLNKEFSKIINDTFHFLSDSNLGTLRETEEFANEDDKPDLIITNPPYITSGVTTIRRQIEEEGLTDYYKNSGKGVEGLCLKWIIKNLKRKGQAFIVLPDSIFNVFANKVLRDEIKKNCYINGIISLPKKTFFNTPKKTYVLILTKKDCDEDECENLKQDFPIFTYLVSNIGETLNVNRFEISENDLDTAKNLFNQFKGSPQSFKTDDPRCKLQPIEKFENEKYWTIDKWWTKEEKIKLGIIEKDEILTFSDFTSLLGDISNSIKESQKDLEKLSEHQFKKKLKKIKLEDKKYFNLGIGRRLVKKNIRNFSGEIPIFSANVFTPVGHTNKSNISSFENDYILWGIDGDFDFNVKFAGEKFVSTDHCGTIEILDKRINPLYLLYALNSVKDFYGFDRGVRASLRNMSNIEIEVPIDSKGDFDLIEQKNISERDDLIRNIKQKLLEQKLEIENIKVLLEKDYQIKKFSVTGEEGIFEAEKGNAKYTKKYMHDHKGEFPVYSSQTSDLGEIGSINTFDYDEECFTWTTDGTYVGTVFYRNGKFSITTHCGILRVKPQYKDKVNFEYLNFILNKTLPNYKLGEGSNKRLGTERMKEIKIEIPVNGRGEFDLDKQKEIAEEYNKIEKTKEKLKDAYERVINPKVEILSD